ncbi:MAG: LLM class F420-dependent oxidoreductase, partial [Nocardioidaceae bacterium]
VSMSGWLAGAMRLAVHYPDFSFPGGAAQMARTLAETARAAEEGGCAQFTVMDHYFQMERRAPATEPMLEAYTALGFLAGQTRTMTLGALVSGVTYRHPGLLAKIVTTLDIASGGRAQLGIGAAWYEREHVGLGVPFPPVSERFERLEEALQICLQMWSDDDGPFDGRYYRLAETICSPRPVQQPRPSILIGGSGEKKTLRLVAKYADATNLFGMEPAAIRHKLEVLDGHCEDLGRDPATVTRTAIAGIDPVADPDGFLRRVESYAALGIAQVWVAPAGPDPAGWVRRVTETVGPKVAELTA